MESRKKSVEKSTTAHLISYRAFGAGLLLGDLVAIFFDYGLYGIFFSLFDVTINWSAGWPFILALFFPGMTLYEEILKLSFFLLRAGILVWGVGIWIYLMVNNRYTKQVLYNVYAFSGIYLLQFILPIPLGIYDVVSLITGLAVYFFAIHHDNWFSRLVKHTQ